MTTTVIKSIKPDGLGSPDYTSLSSWDIGQRANITAAGNNTIQIAEVYSDPTQTGAGNVTLSNANWTVDATHYIIIRAASGHGCGGVWDTLKAYMNTITSNGVGFVTIGPGLSIRNIRLNDVPASTPWLIERNVHNFAPSYGILTVGGSGAGFHIVKNCIIYYLGTSAVDGAAAAGSKIKIENCTLYIKSTAAGSSCLNGAVTSQNNYLAIVSSPTVCYLGAAVKGTNDATSNTEALTASLRNIAYSTANFVNVTSGSEDLHLKAGSALLLKGVTIAEVTNDIDGTSRVGFVFDIGADQFDQIPLCWNYTARYKNSNKLFKASGCGRFPRMLRVPGNVDTGTGKMVDDGIEIDPDNYSVV